MAKKLIEFGPDQSSAVTNLASRFNRTQSDVVRAGVALLQIATREAGRGNTIAIVTDKGLQVLTGMWSEATPTLATA